MELNKKLKDYKLSLTIQIYSVLHVTLWLTPFFQKLTYLYFSYPFIDKHIKVLQVSETMQYKENISPAYTARQCLYSQLPVAVQFCAFFFHQNCQSALHHIERQSKFYNLMKHTRGHCLSHTIKASYKQIFHILSFFMQPSTLFSLIQLESCLSVYLESN